MAIDATEQLNAHLERENLKKALADLNAKLDKLVVLVTQQNQALTAAKSTAKVLPPKE